MPVKKKEETTVVEIQPIFQRPMTFHLVGNTPLIMNRQSEKMKRELMLPAKKLNQAAREQVQKHNPYEEFHASAFISSLPGRTSYLHMPGGSFKKSISEAAIDIPGAAKAQIARLVSLRSTVVDIFGLPFVHFAMVRQAGMTKTPDTRFRTVLPEWACKIELNYVSTIITPNSLANLVSAAGVIRGVGDGRVEKGALDFGQFRIVHEDDEDWHRIVNEQGLEAQKRYMDEPVPYDQECAEMLEWYDAEIIRRKSEPVIEKPKRANGKTPELTQ